MEEKGRRREREGKWRRNEERGRGVKGGKGRKKEPGSQGGGWKVEGKQELRLLERQWSNI